MRKCLICLQELPMFEGLSAEDFNEVCLSAHKIILPKGSYLFRQGDLDSAVYLVKAGKLKLVQLSSEGREVILSIIGPGEVLGETSLFQEQSLPYSAIVLENAKFCRFSKEQFEKIILGNSQIAVTIINHLTGKLTLTMQKAGESAGCSVRDKLFKLFQRLAEEHGIRKPSGIVIDLELTQQELADMVGASRVMVAQILKELKESGIIGRQGKLYTLLEDPCIAENFS